MNDKLGVPLPSASLNSTTGFGSQLSKEPKLKSDAQITLSPDTSIVAVAMNWIHTGVGLLSSTTANGKAWLVVLPQRSVAWNVIE